MLLQDGTQNMGLQPCQDYRTCVFCIFAHFFPSHLCTHFPSGNLQNLTSKHGVFPSYCAQSCSKLYFFGRHCRCLFEKTHSFLQFLFLRFAHGSFTSVGAMVVGTAAVGAIVVGAIVVGAAVVGVMVVGAAVVGAAVVGTMVVGDVVGAAVVGAAVVGAAVFGDTSVPPLSSTVLLIQSYTLLTRAKTPGNPLSHTSFTKEVIPTTISSSAFSPLLIKGPPVSP